METNASVYFSARKRARLLTITTALFAISFPLFSQTNQALRISLTGFVRDAQSHKTIDRVEVELRAVAGGTVARTFTSNGSFRLDNIGVGFDNLIVEQAGYETATQQVDVVAGSVTGLVVELHQTRDQRRWIPGSPNVVSARELAIPEKAHTAMENGIILLHSKSDYRGSLKQFQRAIQYFPDYYEAYAEMGVSYMHLGDAKKVPSGLCASPWN